MRKALLIKMVMNNICGGDDAAGNSGTVYTIKRRRMSVDDSNAIQMGSNRRLTIGQSVEFYGDDLITKNGKVIDSMPLATVRIVNPEDQNPYFISDVNLSEIKPLTEIFQGVTIEFCGWLGVVVDVQREVVYEYSAKVADNFWDSGIIRDSREAPCPASRKHRNRSRAENAFSYPFLERSDMPLVGSCVEFTRGNWKYLQTEQKNQTNLESNGRDIDPSAVCSDLSRSGGEPLPLAAESNFVMATVKTVSIIGIQVRWTGTLPSYLQKSTNAEDEDSVGSGDNSCNNSTIPPYFIQSPDLEKVRPLYINPAMFLYKNGLCQYREEKATEEFYEFMDELSLSQDEERQADCPTLTVVKEHVRFVYKVHWSNAPGDDTFIEWVNGEELTAVREGHGIICLGLTHSHLYVIPSPNSPVYDQCDYGIVLEKHSNNEFIIEWVKIQDDGSVAVVGVLKCELMDFYKHPTYNDLHEGRIVIRRKSTAQFTACTEFYFGTIIKIKRFDLGQISVHCPIKKQVIDLWPHMIEPFVGMTMQELIAQGIIGQNRGELSQLH